LVRPIYVVIHFLCLHRVGSRLCERREKFVVCEPKGVGRLFSQLDPVRTSHRLFGPKVASVRRGCDDPGVISSRSPGPLRMERLGAMFSGHFIASHWIFSVMSSSKCSSQCHPWQQSAFPSLESVAREFSVTLRLSSVSELGKYYDS
jgi:hypothetical protein